MADPSSLLLVPGDPAPVAVQNPGGSSPLLLLGDHAGRAVPARLGDLGLGAANLARHIAWDIGVAGLGRALASGLDAAFVHQRYSRLVIDCNRAPGSEDSIPVESDGAAIAGNRGLGAEDRRARIRDIFEPYHHRIAAMLDGRQARVLRTILVSLHSFTPTFAGLSRPWRFGVLHRADSAFSDAVLTGLRARWGAAVGDNQPYAMDGLDHTIPLHADPRGLDYLELEVRQDLIATVEQQSAIARSLTDVLRVALVACGLPA